MASSEYTPIDDVDRQILQLLQRDARNQTAIDIADEVGVSDGTVRNRIDNLEEKGIIEGYVPKINYEQAGYQFEVKVRCTARIVEREALAQEARQIEGVVEIQEMMTGRKNVDILAVAPIRDDVTRIAKSLDEMGFDVEQEILLRDQYYRPFSHFGTEEITAEDRE